MTIKHSIAAVTPSSLQGVGLLQTKRKKSFYHFELTHEVVISSDDMIVQYTYFHREIEECLGVVFVVFHEEYIYLSPVVTDQIRCHQEFPLNSNAIVLNAQDRIDDITRIDFEHHLNYPSDEHLGKLNLTCPEFCRIFQDKNIRLVVIDAQYSNFELWKSFYLHEETTVSA